jgi:hypothetical protein
MKIILKIIALIPFSFFIMSCGNDITILADKDFSNGRWLLVNINDAKQTFYVIDNKNILRENANGFSVHLAEGQNNTVCDGSIKLYKDGELIDQCNYLNQSCLVESNAIKEAYKQGYEEWLYPKNQQEYKRLWDSLLLIKNCYPTRYSQQYEKRTVIQIYMYK